MTEREGLRLSSATGALVDGRRVREFYNASCFCAAGMEPADDPPAGRSAEDVTEVLGPEGGMQSSASVADAADLSMQTPAPAGTVLVEPTEPHVVRSQAQKVMQRSWLLSYAVGFVILPLKEKFRFHACTACRPDLGTHRATKSILRSLQTRPPLSRSDIPHCCQPQLFDRICSETARQHRTLWGLQRLVHSCACPTAWQAANGVNAEVVSPEVGPGPEEAAIANNGDDMGGKETNCGAATGAEFAPAAAEAEEAAAAEQTKTEQQVPAAGEAAPAAEEEVKEELQSARAAGEAESQPPAATEPEQKHTSIFGRAAAAVAAVGTVRFAPAQALALMYLRTADMQLTRCDWRCAHVTSCQAIVQA